MSEPGFTPGPWALRGYQIRADDGRGAHVATYQISEADGHLIAAAPDLYEALQVLLADHEEQCPCIKTVQAREALEKAEGR